MCRVKTQSGWSRLSHGIYNVVSKIGSNVLFSSDASSRSALRRFQKDFPPVEIRGRRSSSSSFEFLFWERARTGALQNVRGRFAKRILIIQLCTALHSRFVRARLCQLSGNQTPPFGESLFPTRVRALFSVAPRESLFSRRRENTYTTTDDDGQK